MGREVPRFVQPRLDEAITKLNQRPRRLTKVNVIAVGATLAITTAAIGFAMSPFGRIDLSNPSTTTSEKK